MSIHCKEHLVITMAPFDQHSWPRLDLGLCYWCCKRPATLPDVEESLEQGRPIHACAKCLLEAVPNPDAAPPRREAPPLATAPKIQRTSRAVERRVVAMAKRGKTTEAIVAKLKLHPRTVARIRVRHGILPPPRSGPVAAAKPSDTVNRDRRARCPGCGWLLPFEMRRGRRVLLDAEVTDAGRRPHRCRGKAKS